MVVGADVTHPNKDSIKECPSMAGLVATYDENYAHYLPSARLQRHNDDVRFLSLTKFAISITNVRACSTFTIWEAC